MSMEVRDQDNNIRNERLDGEDWKDGVIGRME